MALPNSYSNAYEDMPAPAAPAFSDADINAYVQANIGNPQAIADAAQQYGVSAADLSRATGYDTNTVSNYFGNAGINMFGRPQQGFEVQPPANLPPQQPIYQPPAPQVFAQDEIKAPNTGITSLGVGASGNMGKPVDLGNGTFRTPGGNIIDSEGRPVAQGTTLAPVTLPPPVPPVGTVLPPLKTLDKTLEETKYGTVTPFTTTQIRDYVSGVMGDATLSPFERTNKVMEAAQKAGISQGDLTAMYGKDVVDPYIKSYGASIKDFITNTLAKDEGTTFDEIANIKNAARQFGLDTDEIVKYSGMNKTGIDSLFDAYDKGLASLAKGFEEARTKAGDDTAALSTAEVNKAKTLLALQSQYKVTDEDLAKAGNTTVKAVQDYLNPIKDAPKTLESLLTNSTMSGADIRAKIEELKKNPAISGIYSAALQKFSDNAAKDYSGTYGNKNYESLNPLAVSTVLSQLKAQQEAGTAQYYQGGAKDGKKGGFGSLDAMTEDMAKNLVAAGITDIRQVGEKTITEVDEEGNETKRTIVVNKLTGEPINKASNYAERTTGNSWSGTFKGKGNTGYNVQFKDGNPIFYTTGASSSDMQDLAPFLAIASFIPGAAPFVAAINAAYAASEGNWKQAILSALPVAGDVASKFGASASTVNNINTASKIANVANAIDKKDLLGLAMSGTGLASDKNLFGDSAFNPKANVLGDFSTKDLLTGASAVKALGDKDYASLANVAAQMSGSKDAVTAAKGLSMIKALESKNPMAIAQMATKLNLTNDAIGNGLAGGGLASLPGLIKNSGRDTLTDKTAFDGLNGSLVAKMLNKQPPAIRAAMLKQMTQAA
jgi:hypothetical protein